METVVRRKNFCAFGAMIIYTGAYAQSSVTLYGIISDGVEYVSNAGGNRCVFRMKVTGRFGIVTGDFGNVTGRFGNVTERTGQQDWRCA